MTPEGTLVTITRAQALAAGYDDNDVAAAIRDGRWTRVRRGTYAVASSGGSPLSLEERHVQRARAIGARLRTGFALSHQSALLVHAIPVWGASLENVLVTRPATTSRTRAGVTFHRADLERHESVLVATLPVTSLSRSLVDLAAETGFEPGVCSMDAALRSGAVCHADLARAVARRAGRTGAAHARRAVAFADGGSESVGESRLRVAISEVGLPRPVLQRLFQDERGRAIGRVDFWWPDANVIGEFDGLVKYRGTMGQPVEVLIAEKRREDRLRALTGATVVRVTWRELDDRPALERSLRRALAEAAAC